MEDRKSFIEELFERIENYAKSSAELIRLKAIDKSADLISSAIARIVVVFFFVMFFLVLNIAIALWIGELLGKMYYGFFIEAGFYALVGVLFYIFRDKWIKTPVRNSIIDQVLN